MKMKVEGILVPTVSPTVEIEHNGQTLSFSVASFGRGSFPQEFDVFDQINKYWSTLTKERQDQIFKIYTDIATLFMTVWDRTALTIDLNKKVVELLNAHEFEDVHQWVLYSSDIALPDSFKSEYIPNIDRQGSREQTYIRSDYTKLITMAVILRSMIPVWGEFITNTRQETGTLYKEFYAFQLLNHSKLLHSEAFDKLMTYIDRTVGEDRKNPSAILEGISSEDFTTWMMSLVMIRRLCIGDIRGIDPRANLVTFIHRYVTSKMKGTDIAADSMVKFKRQEDTGTDIEAKLSSLERYKIKHDISLGEIVEMEYSIADTLGVACRLSSRMTPELLDRCVRSARVLQSHRLLDPQIMLLRWIMKPVISPRGLMYLSKDTLVRALGISQAVLWARGHHYLALLATSHANVVEGEIHVSGMDSRQRIPKEMQAELDELYPFKKIVGGKKTGQRPINLAIKSIETLADNLSMFSWNMTADEGLIQEVFGHSNTRRIPIPSDIKIKLAQLTIELGKRNWN